jgi:hypothetical protein
MSKIQYCALDACWRHTAASTFPTSRYVRLHYDCVFCFEHFGRCPISGCVPRTCSVCVSCVIASGFLGSIILGVPIDSADRYRNRSR